MLLLATALATIAAVPAPQSVIIVGGGTAGLASAWVLARRGVQVTVLEQFTVANALSSHSGYTRITRQAYHEGSGYVPLIRESEAQWVALGRAVEQALLVRTGLLEFGPPDDPDFLAATEACVSMGVEHAVYDAAEAQRRWPITIPSDWTACLSPSGGYLRVPQCLGAMRIEAERAGATVRERTRVAAVLQGEREAGVVLVDGTRMVADRVVVSAGPWLPKLLPRAVAAGVTPLRRVAAWVNPAGAATDALRQLPVWGAFLPHGFFYGFPLGEEGVSGLKIACHTEVAGAGATLLGKRVDPDEVDRAVGPQDLEPLSAVLRDHFPSAVGPFVHDAVCMYSVTRDWSFLIDRVPDDPRVVVAGGLSGHGFKFAPAVGRLVAELVTTDASPHDSFSFAHHGAG